MVMESSYNLAPIEVWKAYEQLEKNKVKGSPTRGAQVGSAHATFILTNLISLIRTTTGLDKVLEPFTELVNNRFDNWLKQQGQFQAGSNDLVLLQA